MMKATLTYFLRVSQFFYLSQGVYLTKPLISQKFYNTNLIINVSTTYDWISRFLMLRGGVPCLYTKWCVCVCVRVCVCVCMCYNEFDKSH